MAGRTTGDEAGVLDVGEWGGDGKWWTGSIGGVGSLWRGWKGVRGKMGGKLGVGWKGRGEGKWREVKVH